MSTAGPSRRRGGQDLGPERGLLEAATGSSGWRGSGAVGRPGGRPASCGWGPQRVRGVGGDADWRSAPDGLSGDSRVIWPRLQVLAEVVGSQVRKEAH